MIFEFDWFSQDGVTDTISIIYTIVDIIRIIVPIVLIVMTTIDISKHVIDPEEKDGQKKIITRAIAAVIVFFIPAFINFAFNLMGIDIDGITIKRGSNGGSNVNTNTNTNTNDNTIQPTPQLNILSSINIKNCPALSSSYKPGDKITLNTDIPSSFNDTITWTEERENQKVFNIIPSADKKSVTLEVVNKPNKSIADITVRAGGAKKSCTILIQTPEELSNISITNCPSSTEKYAPGDKITLNSDIPSSYKGKIEWSLDSDQNNFIIIPSNDNRSATLEVNNNPKSSSSVITLYADNKVSTCILYINDDPDRDKPKLSSLSITNCPEATQSFNPGEKITINTDIPLDFAGEIKWVPDKNHNEFNITPSADKRSATLEVVAKPTSIMSSISVSAGGQYKSCTIFVRQIPSIKITNCPSRDVVYNPGDKITLNTDIPLDFAGEIKWIPDNFNNNFIITPSADKRSATLEVISKPTSTFSTTTAYAGGAADACIIFVKKS